MTLLCTIRVDADEPEVVANAVRVLRRETLTLDVEPLKAPPGTQNLGAKSAAELDFASFAIAVAPTVLPALVSLIKDWLKRNTSKRVHLELCTSEKQVRVEFDPERTSLEEVDRALAMLERHVGT